MAQIINPFLRGQMAAEAAGMAQERNNLTGLAMLLKDRREQEEMALRREALAQATADRAAMARYRDAQIAEMQRKAEAGARQEAALGGLASLLARPFQGVEGQGSPAPTAVVMNEDAALRAAMEADRRGEQVRVDVPNPGLVQGLAVAADPTRAIPEILRQQRPAPPAAQTREFTPVTGGFIDRAGNFTRTAPEPVRPERKVYDSQRGGIVDIDTGAFTPAAAAGGAPLPTRATPERAMPGSAITKLQENQQNLRRAEQALSLITGVDAAGKPVAAADPDATGWKGFLPDAWLQRGDPSGVDARAAIADLGSLIIHDRSGAAVTAAEFPRLRPFIPQVTDDPDAAKKKLTRFVAEYRNVVQETVDFYKESGYKVPDHVLRGGSATQPGGPKRINTDAEYNALPSGTEYIAPDGSRRRKK